MARKRGNGEGTIFKDKTRDRWIGQYSIYTLEGTKRKSVYGASRAVVRDKLTKILNEVNKGAMIDDTKITLQDWIIVWINDYKKLALKRTSIDNYYRYFNAHIKDSVLGKTPMKKVTSIQIQKFINDKSINGRIDGSGGMRRASVKHIFNVIYGAIEQAVKNNMITQNPCRAVSLPKNDKKETLYFTPEQANQFLEAVKKSKYYPLYSLELITGLRLGEIVALRWENINLEEKKIEIKLNAAVVSKQEQKDDGVLHSEVILQTPKTKKSMRTLYIEEPLVSMLKNLRKEQLRKHLEYGDAFENSGFVFTNDYGRMMHPRTVQDHFKRMIKKIGLPNLHFHSLRHTAATLMLFNGVDIKTVQEVLGHEDIQTTLGIYTHVMEDMKRDAQKKIYSSIYIKESSSYIA